MEFIFAAAFCSVFVSILLKVCKNKGLQPIKMITWNYAIASILCFLWFKPDLAHISIDHTPWWLIITLGVLLPSIFLFLAKSLQTAGILKTEIAQRLSIVLSLTAAYFLFQEQFNSLKILGVVLGVVAVLCVLFSSRESSQKNHQGLQYLALVWFGYALVDILLKYTTGLGLQFSVALNLMFIFAFIFSSSYVALKYQSLGTLKEGIAGILLGVVNFLNIAFYVKAHMLLKASPAVVFAGMNILVVVFGVLAGLIFFQEKLRTFTVMGLFFGLVSVACLAYAMSLA